MVYLLNFNITYIIILATCFDSYESSSGINFQELVPENYIYIYIYIYFRQHNNMIYLLNFNITYIIILATCFDSYQSSSGINFQELVLEN